VIVVIDTNVWISALQFAKRRRTPTLALEKAMREDVILSHSIRVRIRGAVKVCRDPGDDMFLECAALAKANLLVAGDKDLLTLGTYKGTRMVTPSEYLRAG
jgi:predicted nucleic acid-binding protein